MIAQIALLSALLAPVGPDDEKPFDVMVGDPAPAMTVKEWLQGEPIESFAAGQVYVVEFWATWCGPCRVAIPHMNELHKKYGERVQFAGISVWESLERLDEGAPHPVPAFIEQMGDKMTYRVAIDRRTPEDPKRMADGWMTAAGQRGIPTAFIVNGEGNIAWIGHPMSIDEPLAKVVAGEWDVAAEAKSYREKMMLEAATEKVSMAMREAYDNDDIEGALAALDAGVAKYPGLETRFGITRYNFLVSLERKEEAAKYGRHLVANVIGDNAGALNNMAWSLVKPGSVTAETDVALAVLAGERGCEVTEWKDPSLLDTLAVALWADGQKERAIEIQTKAVSFAEGRMLKQLEGRLAEFKEAISKEL